MCQTSEPCDVCSGTGKTMKGDKCVCRNGTLYGLVEHFRNTKFDDSVEMDKLRVDLMKRNELLKEINEWMTFMGFDGHGFKLQRKIKRLLWPEQKEGKCRRRVSTSSSSES